MKMLLLLTYYWPQIWKLLENSTVPFGILINLWDIWLRTMSDLMIKGIYSPINSWNLDNDSIILLIQDFQRPITNFDLKYFSSCWANLTGFVFFVTWLDASLPKKVNNVIKLKGVLLNHLSKWYNHNIQQFLFKYITLSQFFLNYTVSVYCLSSHQTICSM